MTLEVDPAEPFIEAGPRALAALAPRARKIKWLEATIAAGASTITDPVFSVARSARGAATDYGLLCDDASDPG